MRSNSSSLKSTVIVFKLLAHPATDSLEPRDLKATVLEVKLPRMKTSLSVVGFVVPEEGMFKVGVVKVVKKTQTPWKQTKSGPGRVELGQVVIGAGEGVDGAPPLGADVVAEQLG